MRMWRVKVFYVILFLIVFGIAIESIWIKPIFELSQDAKVRLSKIPGKIEIKFASDKIWICAIANGQLSIQNVKEYELGWMESRPYINSQKEVPQGLPTVKGFGYYGPYRISPDNSLMLLSLSAEKEWPPTSFVTVDTDSKETAYIGKIDTVIQDMVWSPDSSMFILLQESSRRSLSVRGLIRIILSHPVDVTTFYLGIYDRKGNLLVRSKLASGLVGGRAQVSWRESGT